MSSKATAALDELSRVGIITKTESTGQHLYSVNRNHYLAELLQKIFRAEEEKLPVIQARLRRALGSLSGVLLGAIYGSGAKETTKPDSDLDVLAIIDSQQSSDNVRDVLIAEGDQLHVRYGSRISPVVLTSKHWATLVAKRDSFALSASADAKVFMGSFSDLESNEQRR
ncbi:MAG TPA: hypothetical protein VMN60_10745 [Longimicrobiales bacterium]|nr:hypothetical protein [Longimicrobiales bacterium]